MQLVDSHLHRERVHACAHGWAERTESPTEKGTQRHRGRERRLFRRPPALYREALETSHGLSVLCK